MVIWPISKSQFYHPFSKQIKITVDDGDETENSNSESSMSDERFPTVERRPASATSMPDRLPNVGDQPAAAYPTVDRHPASATSIPDRFPPPPPSGGRYFEADSQSESSMSPCPGINKIV